MARRKVITDQIKLTFIINFSAGNVAIFVSSRVQNVPSFAEHYELLLFSATNKPKQREDIARYNRTHVNARAGININIINR